jgi:hypothetical protein
MGVYWKVHECTCIQYTWVYVSVVSLCDCNEFLWLSWVYVSVCDCYDCIWVYESVWVYFCLCEWMWGLWLYLNVFECIWEYVSVCECIWVYVNVMSVFECCMYINFAIFSGNTYRISPSPQHLHSNSPAKIQDTCQDRYQNWHMKFSKQFKISWVMSQLWHFRELNKPTYWGLYYKSSYGRN